MLFRQKDNFLTKCAPHRLRLFTTQRAKITGPQLSVHHRPAGDVLLGQPRKGVGHRQCGSLQEGKGILLRPAGGDRAAGRGRHRQNSPERHPWPGGASVPVDSARWSGCPAAPHGWCWNARRLPAGAPDLPKCPAPGQTARFLRTGCAEAPADSAGRPQDRCTARRQRLPGRAAGLPPEHREPQHQLRRSARACAGRWHWQTAPLFRSGPAHDRHPAGAGESAPEKPPAPE